MKFCIGVRIVYKGLSLYDKSEIMKYNLFILVIGFVFACLFIITFHEGTHIALNNFEFEKVCFLNCPLLPKTGIWTPAGVWLGSNPLPYATDEWLAWLGGLIGFLVFCIFFVLIWVIKRFFNKFDTKIKYGLSKLSRKFNAS